MRLHHAHYDVIVIGTVDYPVYRHIGRIRLELTPLVNISPAHLRREPTVRTGTVPVECRIEELQQTTWRMRSIINEGEKEN